MDKTHTLPIRDMEDAIAATAAELTAFLQEVRTHGLVITVFGIPITLQIIAKVTG